MSGTNFVIFPERIRPFLGANSALRKMTDSHRSFGSEFVSARNFAIFLNLFLHLLSYWEELLILNISVVCPDIKMTERDPGSSRRSIETAVYNILSICFIIFIALIAQCRTRARAILRR